MTCKEKVERKMKIFCPEIAWHNQEPVLSLDIRKMEDNTYKVVTSGSDRHLVVWKVAFNKDINLGGGTSASCKSSNKKVSIEPLADLNRHQKAINVVKFSPNPGIFASGDDEGNIFIWKLQDGIDECMDVDGHDDRKISSGTCFDDGEGIVNVEDWTQWKTLRGHNEDVVDLCWSPSGQFLVSGSVDNDAIVWDVNKGIRLQYLGGHKGYVQGVAWDPFDNYIVTLSTDRCLRIFNGMSKKLMYKAYKAPVKIDEEKAKNTRLFYDDTLPTYSRRICFSQGGELLFAPSGVVELDPDEENFKFINAVHIFARNCINKPKCYLSTGNLYNTAVRCCPLRFELRKDLDNPYPFPYRIIFAVATQESILLYDTQQSLPIAMISNIHYTRLTDISWSDDGRVLVVSSTDGYCTFIIFADGELGTPYTGEIYKFEAPQTSCATSPSKDVDKKEQSAPDSASKLKKSPEIVKITNFFPKLDKSEAKISPKTISPQPITIIKSVKRKELVDTAIAGSPLKKFACENDPFKKESVISEIDAVKSKQNGEVEKPIKVGIAQKLSTSFDRIALEEKKSIKSEIDPNSESKGMAMEESQSPKLMLLTNGCNKPSALKETKMPRRVPFITLAAPKKE